MLKQEHINALAALAKITPEALTAAIKAETETNITIPEGLTVLAADELKVLKDNEYKNGKKAGEEMAVDDVKKAMGLEFQGKTVKGLADAVVKKTLEDAKIEPEKQVQELTEKLKTVQTNYQQLEQQLQAKDNEVNTVKINGELFKNIPQGVTLGGEKIIGLMRMDGYDFKLTDKGLVAVKDGKEVIDHLSNPLPVASVLTQYATENKLLAAAPAGGRGAGDGSGRGAGTFTKLSEIKDQFQKDGKSLLGQEFAAAVAEASKVDGFDMNA